jgi:hypothetical protein
LIIDTLRNAAIFVSAAKESAMKTILLISVLAAGVLFAAPAGALSGGPSQFMPPYPYPSYCKYCAGSRHIYHHRHHVGRHLHAYAAGEAPR